MEKEAEKKKNKARVIPKNLPWGVLVWQTKSGHVLSNSNGDVLSVECFKGDLEALRKMREAAAHYGHGDGRAAFLPGRRKISQSEYEDQMADYLDGKEIPGDIDA
jgi:phage portal protein BeeE